jgi:hypothetical protein
MKLNIKNSTRIPVKMDFKQTIQHGLITQGLEHTNVNELGWLNIMQIMFK